MSYCRKKKCHVTVPECLACEDCLPPGERICGIMCPHEFVGDDEDGHFIDDPVLDASIKHDFSNMGLKPIVIRMERKEFDDLLKAIDFGAEWMNENAYRDDEKKFRTLYEKLLKFSNS